MIKRYFVISNLFLITATIYFSVNIFYKVVAAKLEQTPISKEMAQKRSAPNRQISRSLSYYKGVAERNLFNTKAKVETPETSETPVTSDIPVTDLDLKLWGTVAATGSKSYAVIEDKKERKQNLYREGDAIQTATIKHILREEVILSINGKDEVLKMEEMKSGKKGRSSFGRSSGSSRSSKAQRITITRAQIDESLENINELMKQVKIRPHFENGKPDGLVLSSIKSRSIFRKMGLRNGDIVMGIDGQNIESVDDALKFYESLRASENIALQIKRRGKLKDINYTVQN